MKHHTLDFLIKKAHEEIAWWGTGKEKLEMLLMVKREKKNRPKKNKRKSS
jgi:hypothetical protein